ncbi:MAG: hypothetical protein GY884_34555 [Proteobacteria bacterium]|nr:hypothetical protein [Pseudomonadota bacterium]
MQPLLMSLLVWTSVARAQDVPEAEPPEATEVVTEGAVIEAPAEVPDYADGWTWIRVTDQRDMAFVSLAQSPEGLVAVDLTGGVWLSTDGGVHWTIRLRPLLSALDGGGDRDDEALLLDAETLALDLLDSSDGEDDETEEEFEITEVPTGGELGILLDSRRDSALRLGGLAWVHPTEDLVLVVRGDGTWRSTDGGRSYQQQGELDNATDIEVSLDGVLVAGTSDGVRYSLDLGRSWIRTSGPLEGVHVRDLVFDGARWLAATDEGLFASRDAQGWWNVGGWSADLRAIALDPAMDDGVWIATDEEILRSDNGGERVYVASRHPLPGTTHLLQTGPGGLIQSGRDGVWQSSDGGISWRSASRGLPGPVVHDLMAVDGSFLAASQGGLFLLVQGGVVERTGETTELQPMPLNDVVQAAFTRSGVDIDTARLVSASGTAARLLPELVARGSLTDSTGISADYVQLENPGDDGLKWYVQVELRWRSAGRETTDFDTFGSSSEALDNLYVLDGEVFSSADSGSLPVIAANVASRTTTYRNSVSSQVIDLYMSRTRLVDERASLPANDLGLQVHHELKIREVTALLDGYTDGAFTTGLHSPEGGT